MNHNQEEMLVRIQEYFGWSIANEDRRNKIKEILSAQALAYVEALRLWENERNELFLPRFIAPTDDLNSEVE
jgi:hypothetical protein